MSSASWANISLPQKERSDLGMLLKYGPKSAEQTTHSDRSKLSKGPPRGQPTDLLKGSRMWWLETCPLELNSLTLDSCFFH